MLALRAHARARGSGCARMRVHVPSLCWRVCVGGGDTGVPGRRAPTLLTDAMTQSSTSPLNGRNVTQPKRTRKVARPLPSARIWPLLTSKIAVTHTM